MKFNFHRSVNYIGWIVIVLAFVFLYFSYFFIYIPRQETKLQQRSFRILKEYGVNMFDKNSYYQSHFENYRIYYTLRANSQWNRIQQRTDLHGNDSLAAIEVGRVVGDLYDYVETEIPNDEEQNATFLSQGNKNSFYLNYGAQLSTSINEDVLTTVGNFYTSMGDRTNVEALLKQPIMLNVPIQVFMQGLKFDRLFENIILFDEFEIYYNSRGDLVTDITNPKLLFDSVSVAQGGVWMKLDIRGESKQALVLPIYFMGKRFCLAGIISANDYAAKTRTINNQLLILFAAFLLLVLIGMPILKIIFISKTERLKAVDASGSIISVIFGTGLLFLITIGVIKHEFVDHPQSEERITKVSSVLINNVESDIRSITNLYSSISGSASKTVSPLAKYAKDTLFQSKKRFHIYSDDSLGGLFKINEILLVDSIGIVTKAVTRTPFSEAVPVNLSNRQYFIRAVDSLKSWPTDANFRFYVESIRSYNTGKGETAVSFPTKTSLEPVMAITAAIPSLYRQVLPMDVEFLMVNAAGRVLYHSDNTKNLHENFLEECESLPRLKKAMDLRTDDIFHVNYNERRWLMRIVPLKNTPLFHITLINLNMGDNQNARIFLFSFYFLLIILMLIGLGMILFRGLPPPGPNRDKHKWFLSWLFFKPGMHYLYFRLVLILVVVLAAQLLGFWISTKPVALLFYQIIFIVFPVVVLKILLSRKGFEILKITRREYLPENVALLIFFLSVGVFLVYFNSTWRIIVPLAMLGGIAAFVPKILKSFHQTPQRLGNERSAKFLYVLFIFLGLMSFSAVPVLQFYFSIKNQEIKIWNQEKQLDIANKNLALWNDFKNYGETAWFKQIQGNGIDSLSISHLPDQPIPTSKSLQMGNEMTGADEIYAKLPDPVVNGLGTYTIMKDSSYANEWARNDTVLYYSKGGAEGIVKVKSVDESQTFSDFMQWILRFFLVIIFLSVLVWSLLKYLAVSILNLNAKHSLPEISDWLEFLFRDSPVNKILLQSFNGGYFLRQTNGTIKNEADGSKNHQRKVELITAKQLIGFDFKQFVDQPNVLIWINGLEQVVHDVKVHETLLSRWNELNASETGKVIVDMPFNSTFIDEVYDAYILEHGPEKEEKINLLDLKKKWQLLFSGYVRFNGFRETAPLPDEKRNRERFWAGDAEIPFVQAWNNLANSEKIILYDLTEDGLLNIKNQAAIQNLAEKGLIVTSPIPELVSDDFRRFIEHHVSRADVKILESKLGTKGKWKNTRYLILLILLPLAAFILISQGMSIEKIFGIFAGIITVASGMLRLFDSQVFNPSAK